MARVSNTRVDLIHLFVRNEEIHTMTGHVTVVLSIYDSPAEFRLL